MNDQKYLAIDPKQSFWINASAGSGKTTLLVRRILSLLLDGTAPDKFLCLTYTRSATAEINLRIKQQLARWTTLPLGTPQDTEENTLYGTLKTFRAHPDEALCQHAQGLLKRVLNTPGGLPIQTIHGFCQSLLRRFPIESQIFPYFDILTSLDTQTLLQGLLDQADKILEKELEKKILERFRFKKIEDLLKGILKERRLFLPSSLLSEEQVQKSILSFFELSKEEITTPWNPLEALEANFSFSNLLTSFSFPEDDTKKIKELKEVQTAFLHAKNQETYDQLKRALFNKTDGNIPKALLKKINNITLITDPIIAIEEKGLDIEASKTILLLLKIAHRLTQNYDKEKRKKGVLDFEDLIQKSLFLMTQAHENDWVRYALDPSIEHILIDEAQDTSPEQWQILQALYEEFFSGEERSTNTPRTLFVVGDPKQSIYSFQGADFQEFLSQRRKIGDGIKDIQQNVSYRSTPPVLWFVDSVFRNPIAREGVVDKNKELRHIAFRQTLTGHVHFFPPFLKEKTLGNTPSKQDSWDLFEAPSKTEIQDPQDLAIEQMADQIEQLITKENVPAGDILILLRNRQDIPLKITHALKKRHIPTLGADRITLINHPAVMDLMAFCRFLTLPHDEMSLAQVLLSPLFSWSQEELMELRLSSTKENIPSKKHRCFENLWTYLQNYPNLEEKPQIKETVKVLQESIKKSHQFSPYVFLSHFLKEDPQRYARLHRLGPDTDDILQLFLETAINWEERNTPSLSHFLDYVEQSADLEYVQQTEIENPAAIRIMTIHASKGLQAPIVFLLDNINNKVKSPSFLPYKCPYTQTVLPLYAGDNKKTRPKRLQTLLKEYQIRHQEEENRLLYVALTRAANALYLFSYSQIHTDFEKIPQQSWTRLCFDGLQNLEKNVPHPNCQWKKEQETIRFGFLNQSLSSSHPSSQETPPPPIPLPKWLQNTPPPFDSSLRPLRFRPLPTDAHARPPENWKEKKKTRGIQLSQKLLMTLPLVGNVDKSSMEKIIQQIPPEATFSKEEEENLMTEMLHFLYDHPLLTFPVKQICPPLCGVLKQKNIFLSPAWIVEEEKEIGAIFLYTDIIREDWELPNPLRKQLEVATSLLHQQYPQKTCWGQLLSFAPLRIIAQDKKTSRSTA